MNQAVQVCIGVAKNCKLLLTVNCHTVSVVTDTSTLLYSPALDLLRRVESLWKRIVFTRSFVLLRPPIGQLPLYPAAVISTFYLFFVCSQRSQIGCLPYFHT